MNHIKLNKSNVQFINKFKKDFLNAEKKWKKKYTISCQDFENEQIYNIPNIEQYDSTIINSLQCFSKKHFTFSFSTPKRKINIFFISPIEKPEKELLFCLKQIFIWFNGIDSYTTSECSKILDIYISFTPSLKLLPKQKYDVIGRKNANTAFTFSCTERNIIHVFREEEWFKVLIHETFHNLDLDFSKYDHGFSDKYIQSFFPNRRNIKFYESYCETWALLFHSLFYSIHHDKSLNFILNRELEFSLFQCSKILDHFDIKYNYLFSNNHKALVSMENYKENTPILSYYIFKTIFLYNINNFLEWCYKENDKSIRFSKLPIHYVDIYQKISNLVIFLNDHYKNTAFLKTIKEHEKQFQKEKKSIQLNDIFYFKTLRMTYYDLTKH
tara:strand:+ start:4174 stop:5325 length:1152 start_codon:yes stop_codon:yes gene_type:complete